MSNQKNRFQEFTHGAEVTDIEQKSEVDKEIQQVLSKPVNPSHRSSAINRAHDENRIYGVILGEIVKMVDEVGNQNIFVNYPGNPYTTPLLAMTTVKLNGSDTGRQVVLSFDQGNPLRPIITGVLQNNKFQAEELAIDISKERDSNQLQAKLDGDQMTLTAEKEIVLQCGKSSITLTKAGKIIIRGEYLLSRATGVNKIKGGSVQIN